MILFLDTSIFIAGLLQKHPRHEPCKIVLNEIREGKHAGYASVHTLAETFSVLTRMPTQPKLTSANVLAMIEAGLIPHISFVPLALADYVTSLRSISALHFGGGRLYDMLHLAAARSAKAERIITLNDGEWKQLAPDISSLICKP